MTALISKGARSVVLFAAIGALLFDGIELGLMPVASLSVSRPSMGAAEGNPRPPPQPQSPRRHRGEDSQWQCASAFSLMKPNFSTVTAFTHARRWCCLGLATIAMCIPATHAAERTSTFVADARHGRVVITHSSQPVAEFVFRDEKILRPYCANIHAPGGWKVTRTHPPIAGVDATDHETMHPGIWLAFGDISGADFWRNKGRIEHLRFTEAPAVRDGRLVFATECRLRTADGQSLCSLTNRFALAAQTNAWLLVWDATLPL